MRLENLGDRICILGPSNSGKSTLAVAIARRRGLDAVHLDQLHHLPGTDWVPRAPEDFTALHDAAILGDRWVIDGNYTRLMPQRFARATGVILLDAPTGISLWRYVRRALFETNRVGNLEGGQDSVKWAMLHHIAVRTRDNRRRYAAMLDGLDLPQIRLTSSRLIDNFYQREGLAR
ncbi:AAA family ATPase [Sphingomonas crocodyli]|uniref:AAA family ATPase n=1 Tax=Sphingomonas crocodyli TaxID=1979270 RepID=A0A437M9V0_9SPHN|nr:AAA family ATPase [Sphingomonas crocodyli]RVT94413.1 AAA family ATPase [Sphingomonas crocodyli]